MDKAFVGFSLFLLLLLIWFIVSCQCTDDVYPSPRAICYGQANDRDRFVNLFSNVDGKGVLVHMFDSTWENQVLQDKTKSFLIDCDCGEDCSAYTLLRADLPLHVYSTLNWILPAGLVFDADALWEYVTCMSIVDSNSVNRICCKAESCESKMPYCTDCKGEACSPEQKLLKSGCGPHVNDLKGVGCESEEQIQSGQCSMCHQPVWCKDVLKDSTWLDKYYGLSAHVKQCKFRANEFVDFTNTLTKFADRFQKNKDVEIDAVNAEINIFVEHSKKQEAAFSKAFLGFLFNTSTG